MKSKRKFSIDRILLLFLFLSILEILIFIMLKAGAYRKLAPALCKFLSAFVHKYSFILDIINNLSMTFIMSYIFYIVALIPERKKQQSINKYINIYLINISRFLDDIILVSNHFISTEDRKLKNSPNFVSIVCKDTGRMGFLTYRDHFKKFYNQFMEEYQHLSHYIVFIDDELRDYLYQIVTSNFINQIKELIINSNELDEVFVEHMKITEITEITDLNIRLKQKL